MTSKNCHIFDFVQSKDDNGEHDDVSEDSDNDSDSESPTLPIMIDQDITGTTTEQEFEDATTSIPGALLYILDNYQVVYVTNDITLFLIYIRMRS